MSRNESVELLKKIYQNAKTGIDAIDMLSERTYSEEFRAALASQRDKYYEIANEAGLLLSGYRELPPDGGVFSRIGMWTSVRISSVSGRNIDKMAEVMINGSTEGMIDITRARNQNPGADVRAADLANRLAFAEQENMRMMQRYL